MAKFGPAPTQINWDEFDKLCSFHCTQSEIADFFEISLDTLERACLRDKRMRLAELWAQKKSQGKTKLRRIQFKQAEDGSAAMAIFLGKHHLGQSDKPVDEAILEAVQRAGISREEAIALIISGAQEKRVVGKKTYVEFCLAADYHKPFEKQIEMRDFAMVETDPRLLLGSRGYGKTDYAVIMGIAYDIYCDPLNSTTLIMTKSKERNAAMIKEIEIACIKNGMVFDKANSTTLRAFGLIGKDNSVSALTIRTTSLRGRHPKRIVMDDPVTEDDTSEATRKLVEKKYNELLKLTSNIVIIGQPAHKYDLYAKLRGLVKTMEVPHGTIPELDHDLEAQRLAQVDEASIQASYFLKILSEGTTPFDAVQYIEHFPTGDSAVAFIDPSHEGGDYTAISIVKAHMQGIAAVGFVYKKAWNHCLDEIAPQLKRFNVKRLCFETNALGDQPLDVLRTVFPSVGVVGRRSNNNKHSRIMAAGTYAHLIHLSKESDKKYLEHVVQYEYKSKFDDAPDSLATCLEWIGLIRGKL